MIKREEAKIEREKVSQGNKERRFKNFEIKKFCRQAPLSYSDRD